MVEFFRSGVANGNALRNYTQAARSLRQIKNGEAFVEETTRGSRAGPALPSRVSTSRREAGPSVIALTEPTSSSY